jgi:Uma2 family endonuclease
VAREALTVLAAGCDDAQIDDYNERAMSNARKIATYQDVLDAPSTVVAEILRGTLITHPRPRIGHAGVSSSLGAELIFPFGRGRGGPGGWVILDEPELHLGDDVLVPDLAGWKRERFGSPGDAAFLTLAPDWLCEVLSPSTSAVDRTVKLPIYARERVQHVWLVDPDARTLEVLRLDGDSYRIVGSWADDAKVRAEPFDAVELELGHLWRF